MRSSSVRRRIALSARLATAWRPTGAKLTGLLRSMATSYVALGITLYIVPGRQSSGPLAVLLLVVVVAAVGTLLRPIQLALAVVLGSVGLLVVGVVGQGVTLMVAVSLAPDIDISSFPRAVAITWIAATVAAIVNWLLDAGSQDAYLAQVMGRALRVAHRNPVPGQAPGVLIVQLDGVGLGLLSQAVVAGAVPTVARWLRSGSHRQYHWHTGLPATTPAGQAVLLHGDVRCIPSFRWYEKDSERLLVANRPADAVELQARISTGRGLLADGGVSVSNLFSGDAPTSLLTMSDAQLVPPTSTRGLASFATAPAGLLRALVVFLGQVVLERYQARRQKLRDVQPRVHRGGLFALLRAVTTALLRDLNVSIVAEEMARAAPVIFVDFLDFDELAHHAGPSRPEAIRTLDSLDRVLGFFEELASELNRNYELVVVSDHGQAQGAPFSQLTGQTLHELVNALLTAGLPDGSNGLMTSVDQEPAERWGPANLLLAGAVHPKRAGSRAVAWARARFGDAARSDYAKAPSQTAVQAQDSVAVPELPPAVVVAASGSLGHIYLPLLPGRASREDIDTHYPGLIDGLLDSRGIGAVLVRSTAARGPIVIGRGGWRALTADGSGAGEGRNPISVFGRCAADDLLQLDSREHVGDLVVLGRLDRNTGEVCAFEELVGSHGGLGGDQTEAVLIVPSSWRIDLGAADPDSAADVAPILSGLDVHRVILDRLRELGLRPGDDRTGMVGAQ